MRLLALILLLLVPLEARASVQRFAVMIGNDEGLPGETKLRYAASDASRVYDTLRDLGGFQPVDMVLLRGESADTARSTLISMNERVRSALSVPGAQALLIVYYSGHADAGSLHLGRSRLPMAELSQLVRGSAANFRLLLLDACRSGAVTRAKGGQIVKPFGVETGELLPSDGVALITASTADEDAQESDEIRGSFFTHALVSGLLGAADSDRDGAVSLVEAYRYAYDATLRSTSITVTGTQHPTFRFDFAGQGELLLTQPQAYASQRALLRFPSEISFMIMRDGAQGAVVAELFAHDLNSVVSVRPGRYFVRGRGADVLYEGTVDARVAAPLAVRTNALSRVAYARLVRKGGRAGGRSHAVDAGARVRSPLPNADTVCLGAFVGYALDLEHLGLGARASGCTSRFETQTLKATTNEYDLELRVAHSWDVPHVTFDLGVGGGSSLFSQRFVPERGRAPSRLSLAPFLLVAVAASSELSHRAYVGLDVSGHTYFLRLDEPLGPTRVQAKFAIRSSLFSGVRF